MSRYSPQDYRGEHDPDRESPNASWQRRPSDVPLSWVEQDWVFDGHGGMRRCKLARMRAWWHHFHDSWAYAVLVVLLGVCAVYAACCGIHDAICR